MWIASLAECAPWGGETDAGLHSATGGELRCRGCGRKGRAVVSVKWRGQAREPGIRNTVWRLRPPGTRGRKGAPTPAWLGVTNSTCERWRPLGFLAVEPRCERLTLLIVRKLNGNVDCISVLITNEPGGLIPMAIEPFAHRRHLVSKIRGAHPNSNSTHSHPLPVDAPGERYVPNVFKSLELKLNLDQSQPRKPLSGNG
jgi:hypothetical protein